MKKKKTTKKKKKKKKLNKRQKKKKKNNKDNSRAESRFERSVTMPFAFFFSLISGPKSGENRSKYVSRLALVASWGHLPRYEGAWGAAWGCWRLLGGQDRGLKGAPKRSFENAGCHREPAKAPK